MQTYKIKYTDGKERDFKTTCASDAIQEALMKRPGFAVEACSRGDGRVGITYDVPKHKPLTQSEVDAMKPERKPRQYNPESVPQRNAPWIEEWMKNRPVI